MYDLGDFAECEVLNTVPLIFQTPRVLDLHLNLMDLLRDLLGFRSWRLFLLREQRTELLFQVTARRWNLKLATGDTCPIEVCTHVLLLVFILFCYFLEVLLSLLFFQSVLAF